MAEFREFCNAIGWKLEPWQEETLKLWRDTHMLVRIFHPSGVKERYWTLRQNWFEVPRPVWVPHRRTGKTELQFIIDEASQITLDGPWSRMPNEQALARTIRFCPRCGFEYTIVRPMKKFCKGTFWKRFFGLCPKGPHHHYACFRCDWKWIATTEVM